jgi:hypothetical protein
MIIRFFRFYRLHCCNARSIWFKVGIPSLSCKHSGKFFDTNCCSLSRFMLGGCANIRGKYHRSACGCCNSSKWAGMIVSSPSMPSCLFGTYILAKVNNNESHIIADVLQAVQVYWSLLLWQQRQRTVVDVGTSEWTRTALYEHAVDYTRGNEFIIRLLPDVLSKPFSLIVLNLPATAIVDERYSNMKKAVTATYLVSALFTQSMSKEDPQEVPLLDLLWQQNWQQNRWTTVDFGGFLWTAEGLFELETDAGKPVCDYSNIFAVR